jgi:hypothetical protein
MPDHRPVSERLKEQQREENFESIQRLQVQLSLLDGKIDALAQRCDELDAALKLRAKRSAKTDSREKLFYIIPLVLAIAFTAFLVSRGWAETPTVAIEYNVGEIIGGVLVGIAALVASLTYAFRGRG